jgi:hypothetical protein
MPRTCSYCVRRIWLGNRVSWAATWLCCLCNIDNYPGGLIHIWVVSLTYKHPKPGFNSCSSYLPTPLFHRRGDTTDIMASESLKGTPQYDPPPLQTYYLRRKKVIDDSNHVDLFHREVVRHGDIIIKSGPGTNLYEAEVLQFIKENTSVPVPQVFEVHKVGSQALSISMEFIEGEKLDVVWNTLSKEQKLDIANQLRGILVELRSLKGQYIGSLNRGKAFDSRMLTIEGGPFETEEEFNQFLLSDTRGPQYLHDIASRSLRTDHEIVFTHGNFAPRNIIIKDGRVVGILYWEMAGWYPEHWEFLQTLAGPALRNDWYAYLEYIHPKSYEPEYIANKFLGSLLRH